MQTPTHGKARGAHNHNKGGATLRALYGSTVVANTVAGLYAIWGVASQIRTSTELSWGPSNVHRRTGIAIPSPSPSNTYEPARQMWFLGTPTILRGLCYIVLSTPILPVTAVFISLATMTTEPPGEGQCAMPHEEHNDHGRGRPLARIMDKLWPGIMAVALVFLAQLQAHHVCLRVQAGSNNNSLHVGHLHHSQL